MKTKVKQTTEKNSASKYSTPENNPKAEEKPKVGKEAKVEPAMAEAEHVKQPQNVPTKKLGETTPLDTADDDEYDDAWLPEYDGGPPDNAVADDDWVDVKKPPPSR